jgi:mannose-6-phosphate isomerase-like protein (cupin superfamily)
MKHLKNVLITIVLCCAIILVALAHTQKQNGYILEHEKDISKEEPAPHKGKGHTTAYSFFKDAPDSKITFRKRVLHAGASIGYHLQEEDEVYYILSGTGEMQMNNETFQVQTGDAILTRPGSRHGLQQKGNEDLVIIITYLSN